jgi:hypothetical protein
VKRPTLIEMDDGKDIPIEWDKKLRALDHAGHEEAGVYHQGKIRIAPGMTRSTLRKVLMHETLHGLWERALADRYADSTEEVVIDNLAPWIVDTLRRNPDLVEFIMEDAE